MSETFYKPLTKELRDSINRSIDSNICELKTCESNALVNMQITANNVVKNLINALPDGYPLPFKKTRK